MKGKMTSYRVLPKQVCRALSLRLQETFMTRIASDKCWVSDPVSSIVK